MSYSIIIPAFNESKSISIVLKQIIEIDVNAEIIVVDDCSTDNTVEKVKQFSQVKLVKHKKNMGPTAALLSGFRAASYDVMVSLDADGQHPVTSIAEIVNPILSNKADLVLGVRSELPRLGEKVIALGAGVSDATTGFKAFRKQCITFVENDMAYGGMLIVKVKQNGLRVKEVPIEVKARMAGASVHSNYNILKKSIHFLLWKMKNK